MIIRPQIAPVVGNTDREHWGQTFSTPLAYGVVEVRDELGRARDSGVGILTMLTQGLTEPVVSLGALEHLADSVQNPNIVSLILLVPVGMVVYLVTRGQASVYLKRANRLSRLVTDDGALSGEVHEQDTLLLASRGFVQGLTEGELTSVFDHLPPAEIAEKLTLMLHERGDDAGGAALIFQVAQIASSEEEEQASQQAVIAQPAPVAPRVRMTRAGVRRMTSVLLHRLRRILPSLAFGRRPLVVAGTLFVLVLFGISVFLGIGKQVSQSRSESVTRVLTQSQYAFDEGVALLDLNPVKGRERLSQAKTLLEPLISSVPSRTKEGRQIANLYQNIADALTQALHATVTEPELFFDASLLKKGGMATGIAIGGDLLGIVDANTKTIYSVSVSSKNGQIVAGGDAFTNATRIAGHGDTLYVLTTTGITGISVSDKKTTSDIVKKDTQWGTIASLVSFGGNLYLLDTQKGRIWKYMATLRDSGQAGFSEIREYLNPDSLPDFSAATTMAIDGSVWVGTAQGKMLRFTQGREATFTPQGVEPALGKQLIIYTDDSTKNVYVLDSVNKRVVVLDKDGIYLAEYSWKGNIAPSQLVVSESAKKMLFLAEGKIYAIELK
ncbi:hypothetical protein HY950_01230 [Candidatus Gottesmanbacteria bacterium]|nr:hypothetical protein [Candidatus Gottesmanbacteria bacterium]